MKRTTLVLLLLLFLGFRGITNAKAEGGWEWISDLKLMNGTQFKRSIYPIIQMAANAYRYPNTIPIHDWILTPLVAPLAPPEGGVHALAYRQAPDKIIIAFRGTQLTDKQDGLADLCADMILWEGFKFEILPPKCSTFTYSTLDYFSQALNFTKLVLEAYPEQTVLLTGHSLGAGLAVLVSAALSETALVLPVIGFSPPGTKKPLEERSLILRAADEGKVYHIANEWDEVTRMQWDGQIGNLCLYHTLEPEACTACFSNLALSGGCGIARLLAERGEEGSMLPVGDCMTCFLQTHILNTLITLVKEGSQPICQERLATLQVSGSVEY